MIKRSNKHIAFIAIFFFTAFIAVFITNALCDLEIIEYAPNLTHKHASKSEDVSHEDDHDHDHHDHHEKNSGDHDTNSDSDDPCCEDITNQLESSLFSKIVKNQIDDAKYFLLKDNILSTKLVSMYQFTKIIYHEYDHPPPLDGFSIRVLMQSFLN